eukprot:scaffold109923_cov30-Tisochrysis_lutea.AAC.5
MRRAPSPFLSSRVLSAPDLLVSNSSKTRTMAGCGWAGSEGGVKPRRIASAANSAKLRVPLPSTSNSRSTVTACSRVRSRPRSRSTVRNSERDRAPVRLMSYRSNVRTTNEWGREPSASSTRSPTTARPLA